VTPTQTRSARAGGRHAEAVANRARLLDAASALYATRGTDVPFEEIAVLAGVGRATLYRNFATRGHLHGAMQERFVEQLEDAAGKLPSSPGSFMTLFEEAVRIQREHPPRIDLLPPQEDLRAHVRSLRTRLRRCFRAPLALAQEAGVARTDLTPEDVRIQLVMFSAVNRPEVSKDDKRRAWRLACAALTGQ
jgi:AcrR family transcriptional regulator